MSKGVSKRWKSVVATGVFAFLVAPAWAEVVPTEQIVGQDKRQVERERVRDFMSREGVERDLKALGVDPDLAKKRVDALTDEEVAAIAGKLETLPAGGALGTNEWIIVLLLVILLVVVL